MSRTQDDKSNTGARQEDRQSAGQDQDRLNRESGQDSRSSKDGSRYAEGAPDSSRQFGEADAGSQQNKRNSEGEPRVDRAQNAAGQPSGDESNEVSFSTSTRQPRNERQPARGPGIPPEDVNDEDEIEAPTTAVNEKTGRIETGKRKSVDHPATGRRAPNDI